MTALFVTEIESAFTVIPARYAEARINCGALPVAPKLSDVSIDDPSRVGYGAALASREFRALGFQR